MTLMEFLDKEQACDLAKRAYDGLTLEQAWVKMESSSTPFMHKKWLCEHVLGLGCICPNNAIDDNCPILPQNLVKLVTLDAVRAALIMKGVVV